MVSNSGFLTVSKDLKFLFVYWKFRVALNDIHSYFSSRLFLYFKRGVKTQMQNFAPETRNEWSFYVVISVREMQEVKHSFK